MQPLLVNFIFQLAFATLVTHELDAVHKREWRLLFILHKLPEERARRAFILIHVPLFAVLFWLITHPHGAVRLGSRVGLDLFMIVHAGLHWRLSNHLKYMFKTAYSRLLIYGAAVLGLVHLSLV